GVATAAGRIGPGRDNRGYNRLGASRSRARGHGAAIGAANAPGSSTGWSCEPGLARGPVYAGRSTVQEDRYAPSPHALGSPVVLRIDRVASRAAARLFSLQAARQVVQIVELAVDRRLR